MTPEEVIALFQVYVDDATELSTTEEFLVLRKVFNKIWLAKPWEFAKSTASGTFALTRPHIPKPEDFSNFLENNTYTDNTVSVDNNASPKVIFVSSAYTPYQIINWSDRRQYRNKSGYAYLDLPNNGITFTATPLATDTYEFDYKTIPPTLALGVVIPGIPTAFHDMLYHGMAVEDDIILRFPKAQSYAAENQAKFDGYLHDLSQYNASLQLN
jgi:hypothetical protein